MDDWTPPDPFSSQEELDIFLSARWIEIGAMGFAGLHKFGPGAVVYDVDKPFLDYLPAGAFERQEQVDEVLKLDPDEGVYLILTSPSRNLSHEEILYLRIKPAECFRVDRYRRMRACAVLN
jgi:hypothetical protein